MKGGGVNDIEKPRKERNEDWINEIWWRITQLWKAEEMAEGRIETVLGPVYKKEKVGCVTNAINVLLKRMM